MFLLCNTLSYDNIEICLLKKEICLLKKTAITTKTAINTVYNSVSALLINKFQDYFTSVLSL